MQEYYTFPLDAKALTENTLVNKCNIESSIANNLHLILISCFGECHFDASFGCNIWDVDFSNLASDTQLVSIVKDSLYENLKKYEQRFKDLDINVNLQQEERKGIGETSRIKKRLSVLIDATIKKTNERLQFDESFLIGPLSF